MTRVMSSRVGLCGVTANRLPILVPSSSSTDMKKCNKYSVDVGAIARLHLIDLEPHRHNVTISHTDAVILEK